MVSRRQALTLFANVGIAETYLQEAGIDVVLANEIDPERVRFYRTMYPKTKMIKGNIRRSLLRDRLVRLAKEKNVTLVIATPPCQAMSSAGPMDDSAKLNDLILYALDVIMRIDPEYVLFENVPHFLRTRISIEGESVMIADLLQSRLGDRYRFELGPVAQRNLISRRTRDAADFGVPQSRRRAIVLCTRNDMPKTWTCPDPVPRHITLESALSHVPSLDPPVLSSGRSDITSSYFPDAERKRRNGLLVHPFHVAVPQAEKHVKSFRFVPSGDSVFEHPDHIPLGPNGDPVRARMSSYKRQDWNKPAATVTMNQSVGSSNNVHPGYWEGGDAWSDPRQMTLYEILIESSLPGDWTPPPGFSEAKIREYIGEGIPPLMLARIVQNIPAP